MQQVVIFDLDDTLYKEIDFLKSAYREISKVVGHPEAFDFMLDSYLYGDNAFKSVIDKYHLKFTIDQLLDIYRNHKPDITLDISIVATLDELKSRGWTMGLMTDGRSVTQRNKIDALGLSEWIEPNCILISEEFGYGKPDEHCYQYFIERYPNAKFCYVGDNLNKDFVTANKFGWQTICLLDDGRNVFSQQIVIPKDYLPQQTIKELPELLQLI